MLSKINEFSLILTTTKGILRHLAGVELVDFGSYLFFGAPNNTIEFIAAHADWLTPQERQDKWHELFDSE